MPDTMQTLTSPSGNAGAERDTRSAQIARQVARGRLTIGFRRDDTGQTRLADLYQSPPLRALFPRVPAGCPPEAVLANLSGGVVGGDELTTAIALGDGASATVLPQAAEKIYRSAGETAHLETSIRLDAGAVLEHLPQGTILFEGSRMARRTDITLAPSARIMTGDIILLGRTASGERFTQGRLADRWHLTVGDRLVWADWLKLDRGLDRLAGATAGLDGCHALALLIVAGVEADTLLDPVRAELERLAQENVRAGATVVNGVLVVRWLASDAAGLRRQYGTVWHVLRGRALELSGPLPRIWSI